MPDERTPYRPVDLDDWRDAWQTTCSACLHWTDCQIVERMIAHMDGEPWPDGGWTTDPGAGVTCLSYQPRGTQPALSRQQLRRLARMNPSTLPPVCGGCAATKGTDASKSLHTRRDFESSVKHRRVFACHERSGYCGGWVRAVLARAGKRST